MKSRSKIITTVLAAIAASAIALPAFAADKSVPATTGSTQTKVVTGGTILPGIAGPIGAAAIVGTTTKHFTWFTTETVFSHYELVPDGYKWVPDGFKTIKTGHKWVKIHHKWVKIPTFKKIPLFKKITIYKEVPVYKDVRVRHHRQTKSKGSQGKAVVGCIMGSAFGAITASIRKGNALGNPIRWRSQAEHEAIVKSGYEKQFELTSDEAATALAFCGLGSLTLHWNKAAPVVTAKY